MTIRTKIIRGYVITLGIAITGTLFGLIVGNNHQRTVFYQYQQVAQLHRKLSILQMSILYNRPAKQLSPYLNSPEDFNRESDRFIRHLQTIPPLLTDCIQSDRISTLGNLNLLLQGYQPVVTQLEQKSQTIVQKINLLIIANDNQLLLEAQNLVIELVQSPEFVAFIEFPDDLQPFHQQLEEQTQELQIALKNAEALRNQIIAVSLIFSLFIAIFFVLYTSYIIASPLQEVTFFSQKILKESDFDLQVFVQSNDETNILANSLNQLIRKVKQLLQELHNQTVDLEEALDTVSQQQLHLVQAEKMSSLGQLVAGVAHEINNPISFISGNIKHLEEYFEILLNIPQLHKKHYPSPVDEIQEYYEDNDLDFLQEDLPKVLKSIKIGAVRICDIVLSLRNFSRMDQAEFKEANIHEGIDSTLMILQHRLKAQPDRPEIEVIKNYDSLPEVECYPGQLNQVLMNLLANAIDALDQWHQTLNAKPDIPSQITIATTVLDSKWIEITIADNAGGMPESTLEKIFNPFFTTKAIGKGTGMGLAISHQIITETHQGYLTCHSTLGEGTQFIVKIPIRHSLDRSSIV